MNNLLIILAEVGLVIVVFLLLTLLIANLFKILSKFPILNFDNNPIRILRRNLIGLVFLVGLVLCIGLVAGNVYLIYRGEDLQKYTLDLIRLIPSGFWVTLGIGIAKCVGIIILAALGLKVIKSYLKIASNSSKNIDQSTTDDESIEAFFNALYQRIKGGTWIWIIINCTQFLQFPAIVSQYLYIGLRIYLIIGVGLLILKAVEAIVDTLDALSVRYSSPDNLLRFYDRLQHLIPFLKRCLEFVLYACIATLVTQQIQSIAQLSEFGLRIIKIITIIFLSRVFFDVIYILAQEVLLKEQNLTERQKSRRLTLIPLFRSLLQYFIYFSVGISILYILDIDPTPILAGAGIVGIALGLGAQELVNDIVCGFFILFENYYLVGDYIEAGKLEERPVEGIVEAIELRTTRIRHPNGQLQIISNGDIGSITNYSKEYIFALVEVIVPLDANLGQVYYIIEKIGQHLKANYSDVLEPTQVDSVETLGESNLMLRTLTKVQPGKHLEIQRILRKMFIKVLRKKGIIVQSYPSERQED